jgi:hypothetical protein
LEEKGERVTDTKGESKVEQRSFEGVVKTMFVNKINSLAAIVLVVGLVCGGVGVGRGLFNNSGAVAQPGTKPVEVKKPGDKEANKPADPPSGTATAKVQSLLKERLEILRKTADRLKQLNSTGGVSEEQVKRANLRVYHAELDLCETPKDRIAILEKIADWHKEMEDHVSQLAKQKQAPQSDVDEAKLSRLEAEIALERERAKLAAPAPGVAPPPAKGR